MPREEAATQPKKNRWRKSLTGRWWLGIDGSKTFSTAKRVESMDDRMKEYMEGLQSNDTWSDE